MEDFNDADAFIDDLEIVEIIIHRFPRRTYERANYFESLEEHDFVRRFRLTKNTVLMVLELIEEEIEFIKNRNFSVSPINQLLVALCFYATGTHLLQISDFGGMHYSTLSRIVKRVSRALARQSIRFLQTQAELSLTKNKFYDIASFPNVVGVIDCTHVKIESPGGPDAKIFRNRKGYFSINVQAVSNADYMLTNLLVRWPGSSYDTTIFNNSNLKRKFENNTIPNNCYLLGDSGYELQTYLLTPLLDPILPKEQLYNESHIRTRGIIERLFGIWKRRFPVIAYGCRLKLDTTLEVIISTGVLHNIAKRMGEGEPPLPDNIQDHEFQQLIRNGNIPDVPPLNGRRNLRGIHARQTLIDNYFANL